MTYGELKTEFLATLNRRDITPTLTERFVRQSIQRAQRLIRTPASEAIGVVTVGSTFDVLPVPGDLLKLTSITVDGIELERRDLNTVNRLKPYVGTPRFFARTGPDFVIGPKPQEGSVFNVVYVADFSALSADTDSNWLTEIASDVVIFGAMAFACGHYTDPRKDTYEASFIGSINDLNIMAADDELTNAAVGPAYQTSFDEDGGW